MRVKRTTTLANNTTTKSKEMKISTKSLSRSASTNVSSISKYFKNFKLFPKKCNHFFCDAINVYQLKKRPDGRFFV
jgi:hypothetical protein